MSTVVDQSAELTEGQAFEVIRLWSEDRPAWQRDALRRIIINGTLSEKDLDELTAICCDPTAKGIPLEKSHLKQPAVLGEPISLHRVTQAKGINALPDDQELEFAPKGLTIIYGDNGSGKSGYVRILKNACRTRDGHTNIRRNVEDTANTPQSAKIGFMRGAVPDSLPGHRRQPRTPNFLLSASSIPAVPISMSRKPTLWPTFRRRCRSWKPWRPPVMRSRCGSMRK